VVEGDQIKWYKDDLVLFNRGVLALAADEMSDAT
jgi:hypothetical protein